MDFNDLIKTNEATEKPQSEKKIIEKIDRLVGTLLDTVEHNVIEDKSYIKAVDAIVKLADIRPKFMIDDTKEIKQQVINKMVGEAIKVMEKKGIFDELG